MEKQDGINTPMIVVIGFFSALIVFCIFVAALVLFYSTSDAEYERKVVNQKTEELTQLVLDQQEQLYGYRWIDEASQTVAIPIDAAMELTVKKQNEKKNGTSK